MASASIFIALPGIEKRKVELAIRKPFFDSDSGVFFCQYSFQPSSGKYSLATGDSSLQAMGNALFMLKKEIEIFVVNKRIGISF